MKWSAWFALGNYEAHGLRTSAWFALGLLGTLAVPTNEPFGMMEMPFRCEWCHLRGHHDLWFYTAKAVLEFSHWQKRKSFAHQKATMPSETWSR